MKVDYETLLLWVALLSLWSSLPDTTAINHHTHYNHHTRYLTKGSLPPKTKSHSDNNDRGALTHSKIWDSKLDRGGSWKRQINNKILLNRPAHGKAWKRINMTSLPDLRKKNAKKTNFSALNHITSDKNLASPLSNYQGSIVDSIAPIKASKVFVNGPKSLIDVSEVSGIDSKAPSTVSNPTEIDPRETDHDCEGQGQASLYYSLPESAVRSAAVDTPAPYTSSLHQLPTPAPYNSFNLQSCCQERVCYNYDIGSSYQVYELALPDIKTVQQMVDYADTYVCTQEKGKRVGIETKEELQFLASCLLCNNNHFEGTKNMTNILTSGLVTVTDHEYQQLEFPDFKNANWTEWDTPVNVSVPEGIIVLDPNTGLPFSNCCNTWAGNYTLLLPGNFKMSCDNENTYETWGLLSYDAEVSAINMTSFVICETKLYSTTVAPTTTQGSKLPSSTTATTPTTKSSSSSTTSKITDRCCQLPQRNLTEHMDLSSKTLTNLQGGVSEVCPGQVVEVECLPGYSGSMELGCDPSEPSLVVTNDSCVLNWILDVQEMVESRNVSAVSIAAQVKNNTHQHQQLTYNDLSTLIGVVTNLNSLFQDQVRSLGVGKVIVWSASYLLGTR